MEVVDLSEARIAAWKSALLPIYEPGLYPIVEPARDATDGRTQANLHFSTDVAGAIRRADLIFIAVNTPTKVAGVGAGSASDLGYLESAARTIAEVAETDKIIVEKSTVPVGTADFLRSIFDALAPPEVDFDILSNPEFLAEGTAIDDLLNPDRILIGSLKDERSRLAAQSLADVYSWVPRERIVQIDVWTSELAKLAANCMLAQRISSINSLSAICEATGADIEELSYAVGRDARIGSKMLKASVGFGGSCFKKDVLSLVYIAESLHLPEVARYWKSTVDLNEYQKVRFAKHVTRTLNNTLTRKRIAILGWAYKKNTGDTRETAAIAIAGQLLAEGAHLAVYDPQVKAEQIYKDLELDPSSVQSRVTVEKDGLSACVGACAVVILTEWNEFKTDAISNADNGENALSGANTSASSDSGIDLQESPLDDSAKVALKEISRVERDEKRLDWRRIAGVVNRPRLVFDGRNIVDPQKLVDLGFRVDSVGKANLFPRF